MIPKIKLWNPFLSSYEWFFNADDSIATGMSDSAVLSATNEEFISLPQIKSHDSVSKQTWTLSLEWNFKARGLNI